MMLKFEAWDKNY